MNIKKELPIMVIVLLPFIYLAYVWNELPSKIPVHWTISGEIDRYGDKLELIMILFLLPLLTYLIFLVVPKIDPKNKLNKMGGKLKSIKILLTTFMSLLTLFFLYTVKNQSFANLNYFVLITGFLYIFMGNYIKTIKPNYFIGIRTPWTLENETVWKATHKLGGIMWFIGGLLVVVLSLVLDKSINFTMYLIITGVITIIPIAYSYLKYRKQRKTA